MIIRIAPKVLADRHWHPLLDVIVDILEQPHSRHSFDVSQYGEILASTWLANAKGARGSTPALIKGNAKAASRDGASDGVTLLIDDRASPSGETASEDKIRVHPLGALTILCQPLYLIVEDESSDGAFVLWMARLLGRDAIRNSYSAGRLHFRHAGGKGQLVKSAKALTFGVWPRDQKPILSLKLRAVAMFDSDACFPGHRPNQSIVDAISNHVAFVHMLERRSIENYLPEKYFRLGLANHPQRRSADAYFRMSEMQQVYFPIKRGFLDNSNPPQPLSHAVFQATTARQQEERDLYGTANPADWQLLAPGFGDGLAHVYQCAKYRCEPNEKAQMSGSSQMEMNKFLTKVIRYL